MEAGATRLPNRPVLIFVCLILAALACARSDGPLETWQIVEPWVGEAPNAPPTPTVSPTAHPLATLLPPTRGPGEAFQTPTPDPTRMPPVPRVVTEWYTVQPGDSLGELAFRFGVGSEFIIVANDLVNPDLLAPGQVLAIPPAPPRPPGPSFKIIPDSELVYGPASLLYDLEDDIARWGGGLAQHSELVEERELSGAQIVRLVSQQYSVNPRLLVALLEYQGGWLTRSNQPARLRRYPLGFVHDQWEGLYGQLSWAADQLNAGYYLWEAGWSGPYIFNDSSTVLPGAGLNAGTVGIQNLFSKLYPVGVWRDVVDESGFYQVYATLYGIPFDWAIIPLLPEGLVQPELHLPFELGKVWSYTGGPHSAWGNGSAWAALDFAPPGNALGCVLSNEWITAVADGLIVRSENGEVLLDLDMDGHEQTGWVILYLHVESRDRIEEGVYVRKGDRLGHPSCEGGVSTGTHLHLARKYNGSWISADGDLPFVLDRWVSSGSGIAYDGFLSRERVVREACACRNADNQIWR